MAGLVRFVALMGLLGAGFYGAATVYGQGDGVQRPAVAAAPMPEATRADSAPQAHALPAAVRRLADSPVDGPSRPVVIGVAQPVPEPAQVRPVAATVAATSDPSFRSVQVAGANVRGGPSTGHGVIGRITMGEEVEVVEDPGNGWVRIRIEGDGIDGWVAERLLSN